MHRRSVPTEGWIVAVRPYIEKAHGSLCVNDCICMYTILFQTEEEAIRHAIHLNEQYGSGSWKVFKVETSIVYDQRIELE